MCMCVCVCVCLCLCLFLCVSVCVSIQMHIIITADTTDGEKALKLTAATNPSTLRVAPLNIPCNPCNPPLEPARMPRGACSFMRSGAYSLSPGITRQPTPGSPTKKILTSQRPCIFTVEKSHFIEYFSKFTRFSKAERQMCAWCCIFR